MGEGGRGRSWGWRRAGGRWGDGMKTKVDGRRGLSPLVPPVPVVVSAAVVAAFAAAVPVGGGEEEVARGGGLVVDMIVRL